MEPGFFLSYWRPWDEGSSFVDSWGDYIRDKSMAEYSADLIGSHIRAASREQTQAIQEASRQQTMATMQSAKIQAMVMQKVGAIQVEAIQKAATMIGYQLEDNRKELSFLNRRMDFVIEQNRLGLLLQKNIADLLKIPDSEKERQQAITLGMQFLFNASKDPDLYDDALEEFLRAETFKKQDYFVLHQIGCIYLFVDKHLDVLKARDYFVRAGKYSSVESDPNAIRLVNLLTNSINADYTKNTSDPKNIGLLAADSYEKAALASYILGEDENAINYQEKAVLLNSIPENSFKLAKYLIRGGKTSDGIKQLERAIIEKPEMMDAILCDVDTAAETKVIEFVEKKVQEIDLAIEESLELLLNYQNSCSEKIVSDLYNGDRLTYAQRVKLIDKTTLPSSKTLKAHKNDINSEIIVPPFVLEQSMLEFRQKNGGDKKNHILEYILPNKKTIQILYYDDKEIIHLPIKNEGKAVNEFLRCPISKDFEEVKAFDSFREFHLALDSDIEKACLSIMQLLTQYFKMSREQIVTIKYNIWK